MRSFLTHVRTTDDFVKCVDALDHYIDLEAEEMKDAYPHLLLSKHFAEASVAMDFTMVVVIGNAIVYEVCARVSDWVGFRF